MAIYLKFAGIEGDVSAEGFEKQIELSSAQLGGGRNAHPNVGTGKDSGGDAPYLGEVSIAKAGGSGIVLLIGAFFNRKNAEAVITFTRDGEGAKPEAAMIWTLTDATLTSISTGGGSSAISLNFSFGYSKLELKEIPRNVKGKSEGPKAFTYDLSKMKTS